MPNGRNRTGDPRADQALREPPGGGPELSIEKGQIYGLVGRNGAGKTTIIRMVTAQTVPTGGEIELFGATGERELGQMRRPAPAPWWRRPASTPT